MAPYQPFGQLGRQFIYISVINLVVNVTLFVISSFIALAILEQSDIGEFRGQCWLEEPEPQGIC